MFRPFTNYRCISGLNAMLYDQCQSVAISAPVDDVAHCPTLEQWFCHFSSENILRSKSAAFFLSSFESVLRFSLSSEKTNGETLSEAEMGFG